jgi:hypothetical protein
MHCSFRGLRLMESGEQQAAVHSIPAHLVQCRTLLRPSQGSGDLFVREAVVRQGTHPPTGSERPETNRLQLGPVRWVRVMRNLPLPLGRAGPARRKCPLDRTRRTHDPNWHNRDYQRPCDGFCSCDIRKFCIGIARMWLSSQRQNEYQPKSIDAYYLAL